MKTKEQIRSDLRFARFAKIFLILLIVIMAVIAVCSLIHAYFFGLDKFNFVLSFASSILALNSYLALRVGNKTKPRQKNNLHEEV